MQQDRRKWILPSKVGSRSCNGTIHGISQAAGVRVQSSSAAPTAEPQRRDRTSPGVLATPRSMAVAQTESRKRRERTSRAASRFRQPLEPPAHSKGTEVLAGTSPSSGTSTRNTAVARDFGTAAARVTIIDSRLKRSARRCAYRRREKVNIELHLIKIPERKFYCKYLFDLKYSDVIPSNTFFTYN